MLVHCYLSWNTVNRKRSADATARSLATTFTPSSPPLGETGSITRGIICCGPLTISSAA
jgi:hypothetical protein